MPRFRGLAGNLLRAAVGLVATVAALEGGARALKLSTGFFLLPLDGTCLQRSGLLSMEHLPSCIGRLADTWFGTNGLGFRGPELRDDGSVRILALGDSCTWGWHVSEVQTYPARLQQSLDQRYGDGRYQVINAGVPGYTSYQTLVALREKGLPLEPGIVIIGVGFNDLYRTGEVEHQIARERRLMPLLKTDDFLLKWSRLYRWMRWKASGGKEPSLAVRVTPERYASNLRKMVQLARAHGAHVLLVSYWPRFDLNQDYRAVWLSAAAAENAPQITYEGPRIDVVHPTAYGYRMLAREIIAVMDAQGWVSTGRPDQ